MFCTETAPGNDESRAFITARERAPRVGIRTKVAVYRLADRLIRERDQQPLR